MTSNNLSADLKSHDAWSKQDCRPPRQERHEDGGSLAQDLSSSSSLFEYNLGKESLGKVVLTETVGVPVHAVLPSDGSQAAAIVAQLLRTARNKTFLVTFANPATAIVARRSAAFGEDLRNFDMVLPDGSGMCLAIKLLHKLPAQRVSFDSTSLAPEIFHLACELGSSIVFVGGAPLVAERARVQVANHFPGIRIIGAVDGYGDVNAKIDAIARLNPDIVICGMGSGSQEAFLLKLRAAGWSGWGFTCGGYLDQLQAEINYYPGWVDRANLRWAYRLAREPGRLWRRYLIDYSCFGLLLCANIANRKPSIRRDAVSL
jgi:N-acetylglucosaminyldiphosphoundecaprenol N-acetyl-beta-D-mannosaminyltransferase